MTTEIQPAAAATNERIWGNYRLARRNSTGWAARGNRGAYSGQKIHRIIIEEIVGVIDEAKEQAYKHPTLGKRFLMNRKPTVFSTSPACGCCNGQHAAKEVPGATVTCAKCGA